MDNEVDRQALVKELLRSLEPESFEREGLKETPRRVDNAYEKLFSGYGKDPAELLTVFDGEKYDEMILVKNVEFYSTCLPGDQCVNATSGAKRAREVKVGEKLWTLEHGIPVTTTVKKISTRKAKSLVKISLKNGKSIRATPDHPVKINGAWVEAGDLRVGDKVEFVNTKMLCKKQYELNLNYGLGYALGAVASDGSIQDDRRVCLEVGSRDFARKYVKALKEAFGIDVKIQKIQKPSGFLKRDVGQFRVRFVSSQIAKWMLELLSLPKGFGSRSKTKKFHFPRITLISKDLLKGFLEGYIDGDGTKAGRSGGHFVISSNKVFLRELAEVLDTRVLKGSHEDIKNVYVSKKWRDPNWLGKHGFPQESVSLNLGESSYEQIQKIELIEGEVKVYSFKCDPQASFLVSGVLTHNCEHHMLPFFGRAHVAYIPNGKIIGLSKVPRLVEIFARRLQNQERLTTQVAEELEKMLSPKGVAVVIEAKHLCMMARGVEKQMSEVTTSALKGLFKKDASTRAEFLRLIDKE